MPLQLQVVPLPNSSLAYTNHVYIAEPLLGPMLLIEDRACLSVSNHPDVKLGTIAMSSSHRESFAFSEGFPLSCMFILPTMTCAEKAMAITLSVSYNGSYRCVVSEEELSNLLKDKYANQIFHRDQQFPFEFAGKKFKAKVVDLHSMSADEEKSREIMVPSARGVLSQSTMLSITAVKNKYFDFVPSPSAGRRNILKPNWNFKELGIGGLDDEFATIFRRAFASRLVPANLVQQLGLQHVKGILLHGPPGTGKTLIARQLGKLLQAREPKIVNGPEILNKYVGASEENIRRLFKDAEDDFKAKGDNADLHLIIFDEIDAICKSRGSDRSSTGVQDTVVNQLLTQIDGVNALNNILVIGMTNRKDMLDDALLRPGRLEVHVEISLPDLKGRQQILEIHTRKLKENGRLDAGVDLAILAELTKNFSGAEIEGLVRAAVSYALYQHVDPAKGHAAMIDKESVNTFHVSMAEFRFAFNDVHPAFGVSEDELKKHQHGELIPYNANFRELMLDASQLILQFHEISKSRANVMSVLIHGPAGCGKTSIITQLGLDSNSPFVRLISADAFVGLSEPTRIHLINKIFEDAYKSPLSLILLDNIERLIEYTRVGPRFSNPILQTLMVVLTRPPPRSDRKLVILATTRNLQAIEELELVDQFSFVMPVPVVNNDEEARIVFAHHHVEPSEDLLSSVVYPIPIKQLLSVIDMPSDDHSCVKHLYSK